METIVNPGTQTEAKTMPPDKTFNRRQLLEAGVWSSAALAGMTMLGIGGRFVVGQALAVEPGQWVKLAEVSTIAPGQVLRISYTAAHRDAWRRTEKKGLLYVTVDAGGDYLVLDATCTHLGCTVQWAETEGHFQCPCHDARFSAVGAVVSGPPPEALRQLATKWEADALWAQV